MIGVIRGCPVVVIGKGRWIEAWKARVHKQGKTMTQWSAAVQLTSPPPRGHTEYEASQLERKMRLKEPWQATR
jgi:hypothetical protein